MGARASARGQILARGNTSDVIRWSAGTVVKLLRRGIPDDWAEREAAITQAVHAAGLPAPACDGVVRVAGRIGMMLEWIDGDTMWERMKAAPDQVPALIGRLVALQSALHTTTDVPGLSPMAERVRGKLESATRLPDHERREAVALLGLLPAATAVCHGDMHPANVLLSSRGPIVVDWFDAASGPPVSDRARSSLLMRPDASAPAQPPHLGGSSRAFLQGVHDAYVAELAAQDLDDGWLFSAWEAVLAVARLAEPVPPGELVAIWARWKAGRDAVTYAGPADARVTVAR